MKNIIERLNESKLSNVQKLNCSVMTYLIWKLVNKGEEKSVKWMLERTNENLYDDLLDFLSEAEFENIPELLGEEEVETYISYLKDISEEEIDKLIR